MNVPRLTLFVFFSFLWVGDAGSSSAAEYIYRGQWNTTNRKLDGVMTCVVVPKAKHEWRGRFSGVWQGVEFDHTVDFTGPPSELHGTATVDGAAYIWRARIDRERFVANFTGDRYSGSFDLARVRPATAARAENRPATVRAR